MHKIHYNTKLKKKLKQGGVAYYNIWAGNGMGLFSMN